MKIILSLAFLSGCLVAAQTQTNCLNTLAYDNTAQRTTCYNATWFIIPVPKASVQSLVPYPLLTPPFSDKSLFPTPFPAGFHPVVIASGLQNDIRQLNLQIQNLYGASIIVPYVDYLKNGQSPFNFPLQNYIGGYKGQNLATLVPSLVGTLEGTNIFPGSFTPNTEAYAPLASNPNEFVAQVRQLVLPNPISGPGVEPPVFDLDFIQSPASSPAKYTQKTFHTLINQPSILNNQLLCQRNTYYFNETFAAPTLRSGNVTVYGPLRLGNAPAVLDNRYVKQGGYSVSSVMVGYDVESCASAAANVDPASLQ